MPTSHVGSHVGKYIWVHVGLLCLIFFLSHVIFMSTKPKDTQIKKKKKTYMAASYKYAFGWR